MGIILTNAFSLNMISTDCDLQVRMVDVDDVKALLKDKPFTSAVGHDDVAKIISNMLGINVPMNRITLDLQPDDVVIVGQYKGPRLQPGATKLPDGAKIVFFKIIINNQVG